MVMTYYRDKLAWKLFDVRTLKDTVGSIKNTFGKGNGFQSNSQPGKFNPIKAQERANVSMLPQPEQPGNPAWQQQVKQAALSTVIPEWIAPVGTAAAGLGAGVLTGAMLTPVNKAFGVTAGTAAGLGAAYLANRWLAPEYDEPGAPEAMEEIDSTVPDYFANTALGAGLGGMAGAGLGYLVGDSFGVVPGMALGAGLGGYAGYRSAGYLY